MQKSGYFDPIQEIEQTINHLTQLPPNDCELLVLLLEGNGLPPVGHDEPAFLWILRGLPRGANRHERTTRLAEQLALILERKPDIHPVGTRPSEVLYNLLELCAALNYPDQLARQLRAMFQRRKLDGDWRGIPLRAALLHALICNQIDARLKDVWLKLVEEDEHPWFASGNEWDGVDGLRMMPPSSNPDARGEPALNAIGQGLALIAHRRSGIRPNELQEFSRMLHRVMASYPGYGTWEYDLVLQAEKWKWPEWAVDRLPSLFFTRGELDSSDSYFVWSVLFKCLGRAEKITKLGSRCADRLIEIEIAPSHADFVEQLAIAVEKDRQDLPYGSEKAKLNLVGNALQTLVPRIRADGTSRIPNIEAVKKRVLYQQEAPYLMGV